MNCIRRIRNKLSVIDSKVIKVDDVSHLHKKHYNNNNRTSHIKILVVSHKFTNMSRIERHQMINRLLLEEIKNGLHALSIETMTPSEYTCRYSQ